MKAYSMNFLSLVLDKTTKLKKLEQIIKFDKRILRNTNTRTYTFAIEIIKLKIRNYWSFHKCQFHKIWSSQTKKKNWNILYINYT